MGSLSLYLLIQIYLLCYTLSDFQTWMLNNIIDFENLTLFDSIFLHLGDAGLFFGYSEKTPWLSFTHIHIPIHLYCTLIYFQTWMLNSFHNCVHLLNLNPFWHKILTSVIFCHQWVELDHVWDILRPCNSHLLIPIHLNYTLNDFQTWMLHYFQNIVSFLNVTPYWLKSLHLGYFDSHRGS